MEVKVCVCVWGGGGWLGWLGVEELMLRCHQASSGEALSATRLTVSSLLLSEMSEGI